MKLLLIALASVPVLICAAALALDRFGQRGAPSGKWDLIVVPGARVWVVDGQPEASPTLKRRTRAAVELWRARLAPLMVFTGGPSCGAPISEASAAAHYAMQTLGVPEEAILLEEHAASTQENAAFSAALHPAQKVVVVADYYHAFRCKLVFGREFGPDSEIIVVGTRPSTRLRIRGSIREIPALLSYAFRGLL